MKSLSYVENDLSLCLCNHELVNTCNIISFLKKGEACVGKMCTLAQKEEALCFFSVVHSGFCMRCFFFVATATRRCFRARVSSWQ